MDSYENGYVDPNVLDEEEDDEDEEDEEDDYEGTYEDEDEEDVGSQSDQSDALSDGEGSSYDDDIPYSSSQLAHASNDHFHFGNSLTVKGKSVGQAFTFTDIRATRWHPHRRG